MAGHVPRHLLSPPPSQCFAKEGGDRRVRPLHRRWQGTSGARFGCEHMSSGAGFAHEPMSGFIHLPPTAGWQVTQNLTLTRVLVCGHRHMSTPKTCLHLRWRLVKGEASLAERGAPFPQGIGIASKNRKVSEVSRELRSKFLLGLKFSCRKNE